jgi:molybdate transport system ATP-binding protein
MIDVELERRQGDFHLSVAFASRRGITALFGRSGAGKSSVVEMIAGLRRPDRGRVVVGDAVLLDSGRGVDLPPERRRVGYVFQEGRLFPHLTVQGNLRYGERLIAAKDRYAQFDKVVELLGIGGLLDRRPAKLSGGEKQRVAIGRALLASPRLLLMDEPLASLDGARKHEVLPFVQRLSREFAIPIVYVSHSIDEIIELADDLVVLDGGRVAAAGTLEQVLADYDLSPMTGRQDAGSVIGATVEDHRADVGLSRVAVGANHLDVPLLDLPRGAAVRVRIAAQEVALALDPPTRTSFQNILAGSVISVKAAASGQVDVHVDVGATLWSRVTKTAVEQLGLKPGDKVYALVKSTSIARSSIAERPGG